MMLSIPVAFFIELFVRGVILCLLISMALIVCRRTAAAYRHLLCVLGLCGLLILPFTQRIMPPLLLLTPQPAASPKPVTARMEEPIRLSDNQPKSDSQTSLKTPQKEIARTGPAATMRPVSAVPMRKEASLKSSDVLPARPTRSLNTTALLFTIWGLGTAILLIRLMAALFRLRKLAAESQTAMLGSVPILIGQGIETPLTWGLRSHVILMPAALVSGESPVCESALRHEQAHIARWDWAWNLLAEMTCACCWFQPGVWWLRRRMRLESERACDDRVLLSGIAGPDYAAHLLYILRSGCAREIAPAMAQSGGMEERMRHILDTRKPRRARLIWLVLAAQMGLVLLLLSALRVSARPAEAGRDRIFTGHSQSVNAVVFSPDSKRLLTGSADGTALVWDVSDGHSMLTLNGSTAAITSALYTPNGKRIITGCSDGAIHIWDAATGDKRRSLSSPGGTVRALGISSDGTKLLGGYENGAVKIWNTATGQELAAFLYDNPLLSAAISQDGKSIAAGYSDATLRVWDLQTQHSLISEKIPESEGVTGVHFEPADTLYTWDRQKSKDGKPKTTFMTALYIRPRQILLKVGFSFPQSMISHVAAYDNLAMLYGLSDGQAVFHNPHGDPVTLNAHDGPVTAVAISPDGTLGATGGKRNGKGEAKLWDIRAREPAKPIEEKLQTDKSTATKQDGLKETRVQAGLKETHVKETGIREASLRNPGVSPSRQLISAGPTMTANIPNRANASRSVADLRIAAGNVIWGEGVDGLQPGFLPNAHKFANNLFPYNYKVVYRVLVRNTSDRERTFEVHSQDHTGMAPYLIPDGDVRKALESGKISENYRARGVYDEREVYLGYVIKLAAGEAVMLPEMLSLYIGDAAKNNYPRIENIKEGSNWIVQPVIVHSLTAEEMVQAEAGKKIDMTVLDRDSIPVPRSATQFPVHSGGTTLFAKMQTMAGPRNVAAVKIADVVWGEGVDGLQPGFLLKEPGFPNNRVPYNSNVVYQVLVRNTTDRERTLEVRVKDFKGTDPYLIPDDGHEVLDVNKISEDYRARGVTDLSLAFLGYAVKLAPGEAVMLPEVLSLYIGDAGIENYPRIEKLRIKAGRNWIVQPVIIRSMTADEVTQAESTRKSPYTKNVAVTMIDRNAKTSQRYITYFGAKADGKSLFASTKITVSVPEDAKL